jgi:hypothetical protein
MTTTDEPQHHWPEEEPDAVQATPRKRGRLARIGRAFGDSAITIGMSRGMTGGNAASGRSADASLTNSLLFDEGTQKGRKATHGSDGEPDHD